MPNDTRNGRFILLFQNAIELSALRKLQNNPPAEGGLNQRSKRVARAIEPAIHFHIFKKRKVIVDLLSKFSLLFSCCYVNFMTFMERFRGNPVARY
jgi:hypothetical protein